MCVQAPDDHSEFASLAQYFFRNPVFDAHAHARCLCSADCRRCRWTARQTALPRNTDQPQLEMGGGPARSLCAGDTLHIVWDPGMHRRITVSTRRRKPSVLTYSGVRVRPSTWQRGSVHLSHMHAPPLAELLTLPRRWTDVDAMFRVGSATRRFATPAHLDRDALTHARSAVVV